MCYTREAKEIHVSGFACIWLNKGGVTEKWKKIRGTCAECCDSVYGTAW